MVGMVCVVRMVGVVRIVRMACIVYMVRMASDKGLDFPLLINLESTVDQQC